MNKITPSFVSADAYFADILRQFESTPVESRPRLDRRSILKMGGGGALMLAFFVQMGRDAEAATPDASFAPNAYLRIDANGRILIRAKNPEVGQGVKTSLPQIVADEMDAAWADVDIEMAPNDLATYGRQFAGGSMSIPMNWDVLRQAGATARHMLTEAAAKQLKVPVEELKTSDSHVIHEKSGRKIRYAELADAASKMAVPDPKTLKLKTPDQWTLIGQRLTGVDNMKLVTGQALFGSDQKLPDMLYAVYEKCPATGGKVKSANLDLIKAMPGVKDAFILEGNGTVAELMPGVAIVATSNWAALRAKAALQVEWDESTASKDSWSEFTKQAIALSGKPGAEVIFKAGDVDAAFAGAAKTHEAFYSYPFVSHANMEPQNSLAWVKPDGTTEVWAPTQMPEPCRQGVAKTLGVAPEKVIVNMVRGGGGFGRRLTNDPSCEAAAISQRMGVPIKITWTREDDMRHDFYRVGGFHWVKAGLDANGKLIAWRHHNITFTGDGKAPVIGGNVNGSDLPFPLVANAELSQTLLPFKTPVGAWRAPKANVLGFVVQSFIHELATVANRDHLEFLLEILGEPQHLAPQNSNAVHTGRAAGVVKLVAEKAGWGRKMEAGRGLGLAFYFSHQGHFAEVSEVSVDADNKTTVHKVWVAADIGPIVNPSGAENQIEGSVVDGVSTMTNLSLSIENGRVLEGNFHEYPLLRIGDAPKVEVHFVKSDYPPTGTGEPAFPPVAPAVANAVFAATGRRMRQLPVAKDGAAV